MKITDFRFKLVVLIIASSCGFACASDHSDPTAAPQPKSTTNQNETGNGAPADASPTPTPPALDESAMKADKLADEGEALIQTASSFDEASGKFAQAIQTNPANNRAIFWNAFLKCALQLKGILNRIKPLYMNPQYAPPGRYEKLVHQQTSYSTQDVASFLLSGPEDISTPDLLQSWMDQFDNSIFEFRHTIKQIRDSEITVLLPKILLPESLRASQGTQCSETDFGPIRYQDQNCSLGNGSRVVGLNRGDFEALLSALALYQARIELLAAYRINPAAIIGLDSSKFASKSEAQDTIRKILNQSAPGAAQLRGQSHAFTGFKELSNDMVISLKYFLDHQSDLCPRGYATVNNRKGYLLNFGVCENEQLSAYKGQAAEMHDFEAFFESQMPSKDQQDTESSVMRKSLNVLEAALQGGAVEIGPHLTSEDPQVILKPLKILEHPPSDLIALTPVTLDACGDVVAINDSALADDFEKGSLSTLLKSGLEPGTCQSKPTVEKSIAKPAAKPAVKLPVKSHARGAK